MKETGYQRWCRGLRYDPVKMLVDLAVRGEGAPESIRHHVWMFAALAWHAGSEDARLEVWGKMEGLLRLWEKEVFTFEDALNWSRDPDVIMRCRVRADEIARCRRGLLQALGREVRD